MSIFIKKQNQKAFMLVVNRFFLSTILILFSFSFYSCENSSVEDEKQVLIYCGITMIRPMTEIKDIIEKQENCNIEITKGGSGNLLKAIELIGIGDLFLPGSESYIQSAIKKGLISDTAYVGTNKLAVIVQKGNPLDIPADIKTLTSNDYYVIIGNPNSGSVGKATKKLLLKHQIFNEVEQNAIRFTTDSKDLSQSIINKEADIVVNWYATYTWDNNSDHMDLLCIPELESTQNKLVLAQLKSSQHPEIAKKFLEYAQSEKGQAIFEKYGLR